MPAATLVERFAARNAQRPDGTFEIPEALLQEWIALFQPAGPAELQRREAVS